MWDTVNGVGLRNHYICSVHAARMMVSRKQGLIVNVSSVGGLRFVFNIAYGIGKEACDRMAVDCGIELRSSNVAFVSLWPGAVGTDELLSKLQDTAVELVKRSIPGLKLDSQRMKDLIKMRETPEFTGQCIARLVTDPTVMMKSGKIVMTCDLGREYAYRTKKGIHRRMCALLKFF